MGVVSMKCQRVVGRTRPCGWWCARPKSRGNQIWASVAEVETAKRDSVAVGRGASLLALALAVCALACTPKQTQPGENFFTGYVYPDKQAIVSHDFVVKNTTPDTVEIRTVDKSCSCASVELGKYRLAPSESTTLTVKMAVMRTFMTRSAACILRTDHPKFEDWSYTVSFVSTPLAAAQPSHLNLGSLT